MTSPAPFARRPGRGRPCALLAAAGLAVLLCGCGERASAPDATRDGGAAAQKSAARDPQIVDADAELARRLLVGPIATHEIADTIRVAGRFEVNEYRTARIGAPITGRLTRIEATIGQQVREGQVLAEINSPELAQAQLAFLRAHAQQQLMTRAVERAQLLLSADVIGSAELQRRQSELSVAGAEKRAAFDQLRQLGLPAGRIHKLEESGQIQQSAAISATIAGTVIDRKVAQGQVVNPSDVLFVVSDLTSVWAAAQVPEHDAQFVKLGQRVQVEVPALDGERFAGKVAFVADVVNPETRTVRVGIEMDNRGQRFKPSMLITMLVEGRVSARQVVPASGVVREGNSDYVFVEVEPGRFRLTAAELEPENGGLRAFAKPLPEATRVVLDGAFHLNNVRAQRELGAR